MKEHKNKTVVVKIEGRWQLISIEAGRIFTGPDHNRKAMKYLVKQFPEVKDPAKEKIELNQENIT